MKIVDQIDLIERGGYRGLPEFARVQEDVLQAIRRIENPQGAGEFRIVPVRKGNGVKPIKIGFIEYLESRGWLAEVKAVSRRGRVPGAFDCHLSFGRGSSLLPFAIEWETGNISSSHRAINRLALGIQEGWISGGILVLPSRNLYQFLTDRIGNVSELEPYFPLWSNFQELASSPHYLGIIVVEHDVLDESVPLIPKGKDGNALKY